MSGLAAWNCFTTDCLQERSPLCMQRHPLRAIAETLKSSSRDVLLGHVESLHHRLLAGAQPALHAVGLCWSSAHNTPPGSPPGVTC